MLHDLLSGSEAEKRLDPLASPTEVDGAVRAMLLAGGAPGYVAVGPWMDVVSDGGGHRLVMRVMPDYLALGSGSDVYRLSRMTPYGAQAVADLLDSILPSRKIVALAEAQSFPHIPFVDVKAHGVPLPDIGTARAADVASNLAADAFAERGLEPGSALTLGYKKSIVTGPNLDGSRVAIYGGRYPTGALVQPYATPHSSAYSDYSHGVTLVWNQATLDGERVDLRRDVFGSTDPAVYGLASDQGRFDPVFPNAGGGSRAEFGSSGESGKAPATPTGGGGKTAKPAPAVVRPAGASWGRILLGAGTLATAAWYLFWRS